jgi:hypothetical protein
MRSPFCERWTEGEVMLAREHRQLGESLALGEWPAGATGAARRHQASVTVIMAASESTVHVQSCRSVSAPETHGATASRLERIERGPMNKRAARGTRSNLRD